MSIVSEFQHSLSEADADSVVTTPQSFESTLSQVVDTPAVGALLPFDSVSLARTEVATDPTPSQLEGAVTGVTGSRLGIATLGTVAVESRTAGDEYVSLYPEKHVVVIKATDLKPDLTAAFEWLEAEFEAQHRSFVFATGPSATADMGALVRGVHGPRDVCVIILSDDE
ncbi:LUD domain-containing protein [Halobellus limi]|uniref:L-lactate dehydrogenase complex protein LldG n=1 Tax=Halobellus limi TaxID=699433 RepID=A0A1H6BQ84_9EURY|nr:LUD domain-containing protein [Halobellus limi]QCC49408.1 lactate utilization protein C [Halobellus limi]SEG62356.1 L-lactate dehydrogenase complex protein LldG [Halobellus limi]